MDPIELLAAGIALLVVLGVGTVAHELSHAVALRALGVACEVEWLPGRDPTGPGDGRGTLAAVVPRSVSPETAPWRLRVAAITPLTLALPIPLVLLGVLPDPVASGDPVLASATVGWLACALPSPRDFSLVWYAEAAIERYAG